MTAEQLFDNLYSTYDNCRCYRDFGITWSYSDFLSHFANLREASEFLLRKIWLVACDDFLTQCGEYASICILDFDDLTTEHGYNMQFAFSVTIRSNDDSDDDFNLTLRGFCQPQIDDDGWIYTLDGVDSKNVYVMTGGVVDGLKEAIKICANYRWLAYQYNLIYK